MVAIIIIILKICHQVNETNATELVEIRGMKWRDKEDEKEKWRR